MDKTMIYLFVGDTIEEPGPTQPRTRHTARSLAHRTPPTVGAHPTAPQRRRRTHPSTRPPTRTRRALAATKPSPTPTEPPPTPSPPPHHSADAQDPASDSYLAGSRTRRPLARTSGIQRTSQRRSRPVGDSEGTAELDGVSGGLIRKSGRQPADDPVRFYGQSHESL